MALPAPPPAHPSLARGRQVWVEVVERRREWARQVGEGHFEGRPAYDRAWLIDIDDALTTLRESLTGVSEVDPRLAALDVLAVVGSLIDSMG